MINYAIIEAEQEALVDLEVPKTSKDWIYTNSGKKIRPLNPDPNVICINDIAHALSNNCRYTGHCDEFYSVAQHSVIVSLLVPEEFALYGLLHDAGEAYLSDIASPVKKLPLFEFYRKAENNLQSVIYNKFGLSATEPQIVKEVDVKLRSNEFTDLFSSFNNEYASIYDITINPLLPKEAKQLFLDRFNELYE